MDKLPDVLGLLPHRYPFLLVDRVTGLEPGVWAEGVKQVTAAEWLVGTAPGGIFPNGLIIEALAQLSAAVLLGVVDPNRRQIGYFLGVDRVRYRSEVRPGDEIRLRADLIRAKRGICRTRAEAHVGAMRVVRAELTIVLRPAADTSPAPVT